MAGVVDCSDVGAIVVVDLMVGIWVCSSIAVVENSGGEVVGVSVLETFNTF